MKTVWQSLQRRRDVIAAATLLAGCAIGLVVYLTATPPEANPLEEAYASKQYERQIETVGGKSALLGSELQEWIAGLWHGKRLGITVACLSAVLAFVVLLVLTPVPESRDLDGKGPDAS